MQLFVREDPLKCAGVVPPNDVRIDCKAAKHSDGDRGAVLAPFRDWLCENRAAPERGSL
jgi:hypothetical protein